MIIASLCSDPALTQCKDLSYRLPRMFDSSQECAVFAKEVLKIGGLPDLVYRCEIGYTL